MRVAFLIRCIAVSAIARALFAAPGLIAPELTVGRNLQAPTSVRLSDTNPHPELKLTVTSSDPRLLLLSDAPDKLGSASIVLTVLPQFVESPMFWLQGRADR